MSVLQAVDRPRDIKSLTPAQLAALAQEIREEILRTISTLGGHLASSLGAVELCLALHYVFDAPDDQLVWDMGYQAFAHKLITGRRERFHTLKQFKGLSGFSHKDESPYDPFSSGHGGTVLSTALGLAMARDQVQGAHDVVAIIGDASLGEGMALEALNHIGHLKPNLLVILNDNRMSIAQPVGGLSRYLNRIITNPIYNRIRGEIEQLMERLPHGSRLIRLGKKVEESLKGLLVPGLVFEELGFRYVGPINGHSLPELIATLKNLRRLKGPILLHVSTLKGKGYRFAEDDPERFHKTEPFDLKTGQPKSAPSLPVRLFGKPAPAPAETFTEAFSDEMIRLGQTNSRLVAITAAMPEGTGVSEFAKHFPERCIDVGMAEQHALGLAAGLAKGGARPIVAIYSTFLQRAYDQIMHELCLQELPVILAIDRASLVGEDGPTHHGVFDVAYLRVLPNVRVLSPKDPAELRLMLQWALQQDRPVALRYARGGIIPPPVEGRRSRPGSQSDPASGQATGEGIICGTPVPSTTPIALGKAELLRPGKDLALIGLGSLVYPALYVAEALSRSGVEAMVVNARFVKPLDEEMLKQAAATGAIVTLEEAQIAGGFGSAVSEALGALGVPATAHLRIGLPDAFVEHGKRSELLQLTHLDPQQLIQRIQQWHASLKPLPTEAIRFLTEPSA